jgi:PDZ domain-containing protein
MALGITVALITSAVVAAAFVRVPYFLIAPGVARATEPLIIVDGQATYEHEGEVAFATVSLREATALQALMGWLDPTIEVVDREAILGGRTEEENREVNLQEMASSKDVATAVALEELGYEVIQHGTGAIVVGVVEDVPAGRALARADVVVALDGAPITLKEQLIDGVALKKPGDVVVLTVEALDGANRRDVAVELVPRPDEPDKPLLGVTLATRDLRYEFPFSVQIDSGQVGGPSAGLAFTLGVMDVLSPKSITGGTRIATTGTIDSRGNVGPVGGVAQKTVAVRRAGVELFLVPSSEFEEAKKFSGDMRIEAVDTLDEALVILGEYGGGEVAISGPR